MTVITFTDSFQNINSDQPINTDVGTLSIEGNSITFEGWKGNSDPFANIFRCCHNGSAYCGSYMVFTRPFSNNYVGKVLKHNALAEHEPQTLRDSVINISSFSFEIRGLANWLNISSVSFETVVEQDANGKDTNACYAKPNKPQ